MSGKQKEHRRHGILLGVADGVVFLISVALAVLLMLAYAAPRVDPHDSLWFAYLGLAAPFLYLANLVLMLYWTVRWKWIAVGLADSDTYPNFSGRLSGKLTNRCGSRGRSGC